MAHFSNEKKVSPKSQNYLAEFSIQINILNFHLYQTNHQHKLNKKTQDENIQEEKNLLYLFHLNLKFSDFYIAALFLSVIFQN